MLRLCANRFSSWSSARFGELEDIKTVAEVASANHPPVFFSATNSTLPRRTIAQCKEPQPQESEMPSQKLVEPESADDPFAEVAAARPSVLEQP